MPKTREPSSDAKATQRSGRRGLKQPPGLREEGEPFTHAPTIGREAFAKISEVEGIRLDDEARAMFADFDRRKLSAEDRRRAIVSRFKREAAK